MRTETHGRVCKYRDANRRFDREARNVTGSGWGPGSLCLSGECVGVQRRVWFPCLRTTSREVHPMMVVLLSGQQRLEQTVA